MWFQAIAIGPVAAGAAIGTTWRTAAGRASADLEGDHAAERAADDQRDRIDAERVEQAPIGRGLVARRDRRERRAVRPARSRVG